MLIGAPNVAGIGTASGSSPQIMRTPSLMPATFGAPINIFGRRLFPSYYIAIISIGFTDRPDAVDTCVPDGLGIADSCDLTRWDMAKALGVSPASLHSCLRSELA